MDEFYRNKMCIYKNRSLKRYIELTMCSEFLNFTLKDDNKFKQWFYNKIQNKSMKTSN